MRVLLFVQTGDARPKCAGRCQSNDMSGLATWHNLSGGLPGVWGNNRLMMAQRAADRWWLVECENADAGRAAIECYEGGTGCTAGRVFGFDHCRSGRHPGRILASGGRRCQ